MGPDKSQLRFDEPKESELICRAIATLLMAVCCFLQLSQGLKLGKVIFEKLLLNSPGLLDSISSSFESLVRLNLFVQQLSSSGFCCSIQFQWRSEKFSDYQRKVVVLNIP